ncbi:MAG: hypothetical protein WCR48_04615 [Bacteroidales bacterium]
MKPTILFTAFAFLVLSVDAFGQTEGKAINQFNQKGQKDGLWVFPGHFETYFKDGVEDGVHKTYSKNTLDWIGEYENGKMCGTWYFFSYNRLSYILKDFASNTHLIYNETSGRPVYFSDICYEIDYYPDGSIKSEGFLLFYDDPIIDSAPYGEWRYYDETGNLTRSETITTTFYLDEESARELENRN